MLNTGQPKAPSPNWIVDKSSLRSVLVLVLIQVNNHLNGSCLSGDGLTERGKKQAREWVGGEFANTDNSVFLVAVQPLKSKKHVNLQLNGLNIPFHYSDMKTYKTKQKKKKGPSTIWTIKTILKEDSLNITKTRQKYCSQGARRSGRARHMKWHHAVESLRQVYFGTWGLRLPLLVTAPGLVCGELIEMHRTLCGFAGSGEHWQLLS